MAPFLPIRATSRSQRVRIGKQTVKTGTTTYVDLASQVETGGIKAGSSLPFSPFKELQNHLAIGAVFVAGSITNSNSTWAVEQGIVTSATKALEPVVTTTAGEVRNRDTGKSVSVAELAAGKIKVAEAGKERKDSVIVNETTGVAKYEAGTAALVGAAVINAVPAGSLLVAEVVVTATAETATVTNLNRA